MVWPEGLQVLIISREFGEGVAGGPLCTTGTTSAPRQLRCFLLLTVLPSSWISGKSSYLEAKVEIINGGSGHHQRCAVVVGL